MSAVVLAACTGPSRPTPQVAQETPTPFASLPTLPSCGNVDVTQGESAPSNVWACLDAAGPAGAELIVGLPTSEGDLIRTFYRVGSGIVGVEIWTDGTADRFGPQTWTHQLCPDTVTAAQPLGCHEVDVDAS